MNSTLHISHEEIAARARAIWEQSGRPDGQETEHWLRAERELREERRQASQISEGADTSSVGTGKSPATKRRRNSA